MVRGGRPGVGAGGRAAPVSCGAMPGGSRSASVGIKRRRAGPLSERRSRPRAASRATALIQGKYAEAANAFDEAGDGEAALQTRIIAAQIAGDPRRGDRPRRGRRPSRLVRDLTPVTGVGPASPAGGAGPGRPARRSASGSRPAPVGRLVPSGPIPLHGGAPGPDARPGIRSRRLSGAWSTSDRASSAPLGTFALGRPERGRRRRQSPTRPAEPRSRIPDRSGTRARAIPAPGSRREQARLQGRCDAGHQILAGRHPPRESGPEGDRRDLPRQSAGRPAVGQRQPDGSVPGPGPVTGWTARRFGIPP